MQCAPRTCAQPYVGFSHLFAIAIFSRLIVPAAQARALAAPLRSSSVFRHSYRRHMSVRGADDSGLWLPPCVVLRFSATTAATLLMMMLAQQLLYFVSSNNHESRLTLLPPRIASPACADP